MEKYVLIKLKSASSSILKAGFMFRAVFFGSFVFGAAALGISMLHDSLLLAAICFLVSFVLIIVIYRMLSTAFRSEEVLVGKHDLVIVQKGINVKTQETIPLDEIRRFGFFETQFTRNAMDIKTLDITGLAAQEHEMQYVIDEGNVMIETETRTFRFGKKLPSWEVEELVEQVEEICGRIFERLPLKEQSSITELLQEDDIENQETTEKS
jgi:hypothetical protein